MIKLNNAYIIETHQEINLLNKLKDGDFGYSMINNVVINIFYKDILISSFNIIVNEFKYLNDYNLTKEEIKTLKEILIKLNKI
tara:strand:+ start:552 stop:800 length:249 start_codon:yes stop_codon:yes gene_type:complete